MLFRSRLISGIDGRRVAALEILMDTPYVKDLIKKGEVDTIKEAMERSTQEGGQTFDQALFELYKAGLIDADEALANADSANNLRIQMKNLDLRHTDRKVLDDTGANLRIQGVSSDGYRRM